MKPTLRGHLFLSLALAIALPVGLSVALANRAYTSGFLAQFERRTEVTLDTAARLLDARGAALFDGARLLSGNADLKAALRARDRFAAVRVLSNAGLEGDIESALLDTAGVALARVPESFARPFSLTPAESALAAEGRAGFDLDIAGSGPPRFVALCPVVDSGEALGRLALRRALDPATLRGVTDLAGGLLALSAGGAFVSSEPESFGHPPEGFPHPAPGRRQTRLVVSGGSHYVVTAEAMDRYAAPLTLYSAVNIDAAHASLRDTRFMILLAGGVGLLFALLLANLLAARVARPLESLATAATALATHGPASHVDLPETDVREVAALSGAFLAMRDNLRRSFDVIRATNLKLDERLREISLLNRMNALIAEHADPERTLPAVLELLARELGVEKCSVMVLTPRRELLVKETWPKFSAIDPTAPHVTLEWGVGVAGIAAAERRIINAPQGAADPRYRRAAGDPGRTANLLAVPLVSESETVGVLNLVNRRGGPFDAGDYDLVESIARTVSVALAKAILNEVAITDGLTGLYVKRHFHLRLEEEAKRARRYGHPIALALCDLDHFKVLNDTYGHQAGDAVLKGFAERLRACARLDTDLPARVGGEEFALLLPMNGPDGARVLAERLRAAVAERPFEVAGVALRLTVSVGIAAIPDHASNADELFRRADLALYASKHGGRDRVTVFTETLVK